MAVRSDALLAGETGARAAESRSIWRSPRRDQPGVMLVDADLSRRGLSSRVVGGSGAGLLDVADDRSTIEDALITEPYTGLLVLQAGRAASGERSVNPDKVLRLLDRVRAAHTIVVDGPSDRHDPLGAALAASADFAVLVVTAGVSRARDIVEFQRSNDIPAGKVRGVVLVSRDGAVK